MNEPDHQTKILLNRPKKNQRPSNAASFLKNSSAPVNTDVKKPARNRLRNAALTTVLALNAIIVGYTLYAKQVSRSVTEGTDEEQQKEIKHVNTNKVAAEPLVVTGKQQVSKDDQHKLFTWMLEELRRKAPAGKADKAQIDAQKAILKEYLREGRVI